MPQKATEEGGRREFDFQWPHRTIPRLTSSSPVFLIIFTTSKKARFMLSMLFQCLLHSIRCRPQIIAVRACENVPNAIVLWCVMAKDRSRIRDHVPATSKSRMLPSHAYSPRAPAPLTSAEDHRRKKRLCTASWSMDQGIPPGSPGLQGTRYCTQEANTSLPRSVCPRPRSQAKDP